MDNNKWLPDSLLRCEPDCFSVPQGPTRERVWNPFGVDTTRGVSNTPTQVTTGTRIFADHLNTGTTGTTGTTFGRAPQLDPRPLTRVGGRWV